MPEPRYCVAGDFIPIGFPPNVPAGIWSPDPISDLRVALGGNWPKVKPFVMTSADQFRAPPPPPPSLTDQAYKQAFNEAVRVGGDPAHGTSHRAEPVPKTFSSRFWAYDGTPGLCAPPRLYNMVARTIALQQKMLTVPEIARLFALVNVAMADAGIAAWETKFFYQYWRPVTAIRAQGFPTFTRSALPTPTRRVRTSRRRFRPIHQATQHSAVPCSRSCANFSRTIQIYFCFG